MANKDDGGPVRFGRYRIEGTLGHGAMGMVYRAHDESIDRTVALKTVRPELLVGEQGSDFLDRFRREVRAAGRCSHPNIVAVHDFVEDGDTPFIVMEYVEGNPLSAHLTDRRRFEPAAAFPIVSQLLNALHFAHANGIVHRDIKPANVLLLANGQVKVADFGVARLDAVNQTRIGTMVGTPGYMPPEQFTGGRIDHRADLYAAGAVLFEMVTGEKPFDGRSLTEIMHKVVNVPVRELPAFAAVPAPLVPVLERALAKKPEDRFDSGRAFTEALDHALAAQGDEPSTDATRVLGMPAPIPPPAPAAPGGWNPDTLRRIEEDLARFIGPVARVLVRRRAAEVATLEDLYRTLSRNILAEGDRQSFIRQGRGRQTAFGSGQVTRPSLPGEPAPAITLPPQVLDTASAELAQYLGPIARVLVKRTARSASDPAELYRLLAEHLEPEERDLFLARFDDDKS